MTNYINNVIIEDFLVFKDKFEADFCTGVNLLIGENGTGKTSILHGLYNNISRDLHFPEIEKNEVHNVHLISHQAITVKLGNVPITDSNGSMRVSVKDVKNSINAVFIPEKDLLSNARGLAPTFRQNPRVLQFTQAEIDIIEKAGAVSPNCTFKELADELEALIKGCVIYTEGAFFMERTDVPELIPFANEASGYKKLGLLSKLLRNDQIRKDTVLFWDEPENSLNPELIPILVDILLELSRNSVQIFIATHSYDIARWFELNKTPENELRYFNLRKEGDGIVADVANYYISLPNSSIEDAGDKLLRRVTEVAAKEAGVKLK